MLYKNSTLFQQAVGICIIAIVVMAASLGVLYFNLETVRVTKQTDQDPAVSRLIEEHSVSKKIFAASNAVTRLASSFKNVLIRGAEPADLKKYKTEFVESRAKFNQIASEIEAMPVVKSNPERAKAIAEWRASFEVMAGKYETQLNNYTGTDPLQYIQLDQAVRGIDRPIKKLGDEVEQMGETNLHQATSLIGKQIDGILGDLVFSLVGVLAMTLLALVSSLMIYARSIKNKLGCEPSQLNKSAQRIAQGMLSDSSLADLKPVAGSVSHHFELMRMGLLALVTSIKTNAADLDGSVNQISAQLNIVDESASQQSEASSSMAASAEELGASVAQLTDVADNTSQAADSSSRTSEQGLEVIISTTTNMKATADGADLLSTRIYSLGEQSEGISRIIQVIDAIAQQTNLLALNAAIEAARAGEQGRGFAVVADEVRLLAERTTQSTSEIENMVASIQRGTKEAVTEMVKWAEQTKLGLKQVEQAKTLMDALKKSAHEVKSMTQEVNHSLVEQATVASQLSSEVENMSGRAEENATCVRGIRDALSQLTAVSARLSEQTEAFRIS